jgi:diguanylate cyclase (GGDEF)-like protein
MRDRNFNLLPKLLMIWVIIFMPWADASQTNGQKLILADELRTSDPQQSIELLNSIDPSQLSKTLQHQFNYLLAVNYFVNGKPEQAQPILNGLLKQADDNNIKLRSLTTLLNVYATLSDWSNALEIAGLLQGRANDSQLDKKALESIQFALLNFYGDIGQYEFAKTLAKQLLKQQPSLRIRCMAGSELMHNKVKTAPRNIKYQEFIQAAADCAPLNDDILSNIVTGYLVEYLLEMDRAQEAVQVLQDNILSVEATHYQALIAGFYELMAKGYLATGDYVAAEEYAKILIDSRQQHQYQPAVTAAYHVLSDVAVHWKYFNEAYYYHKKYTLARQQEIEGDNLKMLVVQKAKFDGIAKSNQIALLDKENSLLKTQVLLDQQAAQNRLLIIAILISCLMIVILWIYKSKRHLGRIRHMAETDALTGVASRHYFKQLAHSSVEYCHKTQRPVSLVVFDLDHFKQINDSFGHLAGDLVLQRVVKGVISACRNNDIIGRLGGEEFAIILPGCIDVKAVRVAELCRAAIQKLDFSDIGEKVVVTASFGVSDSIVCGYDFDKLFAVADLALYKSKNQGRNRVPFDALAMADDND